MAHPRLGKGSSSGSGRFRGWSVVLPHGGGVGGDAGTGKLMEHKAFSWFGAVGLPDTVATLATAGLVAASLAAFAAAAHRRLARTEACIEPEDGVTARNVAEVVTEFIDGVAAGVIGHGSERYVPLLGSFFVFILLANLIGLVPGFIPPTSEFRVTF